MKSRKLESNTHPFGEVSPGKCHQVIPRPPISMHPRPNWLFSPKSWRRKGWYHPATSCGTRTWRSPKGGCSTEGKGHRPGALDLGNCDPLPPTPRPPHAWPAGSFSSLQCLTRPREQCPAPWTPGAGGQSMVGDETPRKRPSGGPSPPTSQVPDKVFQHHLPVGLDVGAVHVGVEQDNGEGQDEDGVRVPELPHHPGVADAVALAAGRDCFSQGRGAASQDSRRSWPLPLNW